MPQAVDWLTGFFRPPAGPFSPPPKPAAPAPPAPPSLALPGSAPPSPGAPSPPGTGGILISGPSPSALGRTVSTPPRMMNGGGMAASPGPPPRLAASMPSPRNGAGTNGMPPPAYAAPRSTPLPGTGGLARWRLDGYRVLITGSTQGIGLSAAREVVELGGSVCVTARKASDVATVVAQLRQLAGDDPSRVWGLTSDVSTPDGRRALLARVEEVWGGSLDCLVNNAGTNVRRSVVDASAEEYAAIVTTNMDSAYWLCKEAHRLLVRSARPAIYAICALVSCTTAALDMA